MVEILLGVAAFTLVVVLLATAVLVARHYLVPWGECGLTINQKPPVQVGVGQRLLEALGSADIHLPTACGGAGTCGLCKVQVLSGGGEALPQEKAVLSRREVNQGMRLACQVPITGSAKVVVDEVYFAVREWHCEVVSVRNVATLIREIKLQLPPGETLDCRPGSFVQITCPAYQLNYSEIEIDEEYHPSWHALGVLGLKAETRVPVTRAYSMANHPEEKDIINLNIRIALPPPGNPGIPPGIVSSWLFSLKAGEQVAVSGPFGVFFVEDTEREAVFIGGGVGMAPLYAQILDLLLVQHSQRKLSFWYGSRTRKEIYYADVFEQLQDDHENFSWHPALSDPDPKDHWPGSTGFIHQVIMEEYLNQHPAPEDCEYYLCGPPLMISAVRGALDSLGVDPGNIHFDDFGA